MTTPTDQLERALRGIAEATVEQTPIRTPEADALWGRGRRRTWLTRAGATGLVAAVIAVIASLVLVMRPADDALPADGGRLTYPEFVSPLFPGRYEPDQPIFGYLEPGTAGAVGMVLRRNGTLASIASDSLVVAGSNLAPDGRHLVTEEGIGDLVEGTLVRPNASDPLLGSEQWPPEEAAWSPGSAHLLINTANGPAAVDQWADISTPALDGPEDDAIVPAGWRDATTMLGVRTSNGGASGLAIATRAAGANAWTIGASIDVGSVPVVGPPTRAFGSPDGSRVLLLFTAGRAEGRSAVLVDVPTGRVLPIRADGSLTTAWDGCDPTWQRNQPLLSTNGLSKPGDSRSIMFLSRTTGEPPCVVLAGNELTGSPNPNSTGLHRERTLDVALPIGGVLALVIAIWTVVALRRSRRSGQRFLPAIITSPF